MLRLPWWIHQTARCPDCESTHLTRISSEVESRYDGTREWAVQTGARYGCNGCSLVFVVRADGVSRLRKKAEAVAPAGEARKPDPPGGSESVPMPRLPRAGR